MSIIILVISLLFAILSFFIKNKKVRFYFLISHNLLIISSVFYFLIKLYMSKNFYNVKIIEFNYFAYDALNLLFLCVLAILYLMSSLYSYDYLKRENIDDKWHSYYITSLIIFVTAMSGVVLSNHLGLTWVFVESTTLASAIFIYFEKSKYALEAVWKYLFICSIGIAFAFVGLIFLTTGIDKNSENPSLFLTDLYNNAQNISVFSLRLSFPFFLIGYGTKVGLAPVHAWLPDAHSEAPAPISALLSGTLLNVALLSILRIVKLLDLSGIGSFAHTLLIFTGICSLLVSAVYIIKVKNYKRMLAYSSIENMGIIAIAIGIGGAGYFAALLHLVAHSLIKASFFMTAGNIYKIFETKTIKKVNSLIKVETKTAWLWLFNALFLIGFPPSPIFWSEFILIQELLKQKKYYLLLIFSLLLTIIMYGIIRNVLNMTFGSNKKESIVKKYSIYFYLPQIILLSLTIIIGLFMPNLFYILLNATKNFL